MERQNRVTLRNVAAHAGVDPSTASRALNPETRSLVRDETVQRVLAVAAKLGYRPDSLARGLKTNRTFTIGVLIPDLTNPLFPPIVRGIEDGLGETDYAVILGNTDNDPEKARSVAGAMLDRRVDALVLATVLRRDPLVAELLGRGIPVVTVNRFVEEPPTSSVTADDHVGVRLAVEHLASLGHERIGFVGGPVDISTGFARHQSFQAAMQDFGLVPDPDLVVAAEWFGEEPGAKGFAYVWERRPDMSAVVAANDLIALGCYDVIFDRGLKVGFDVSVVGFNDMPFADRVSPPLTTIRIPHYQMGVKCAELVLRQLAGSDREVSTIRLAPSLVVRRSTGPVS